MARILNDFEFASSGTRESHPWNIWTDGKTRELKQGEDFQCKPTTICTMARGYAKKHSMKVRISFKKDSDRVVLQFFTPTQPPADKPAAKKAGK